MDKLSIINNALSATGNDEVNVLNDPSDEYRVANRAFERSLNFLIGRHTWPFATTNDLLVRAPDSENKSRRFPKNCFRLPPGTFHVKEVFHRHRFMTDYEIMGDILSCHHDSEIYATVVKPISEEKLHPMATEILTLYVEAGLLRGLNEDFGEATRREAKAEGYLGEARSYADQQNPARNMYKSKVRDARRGRRI